MAQRVEDFGNHNVLSYVYTTKENPCHKMDQKKEATIGMMKDLFQSADERLRSYLENTMIRDRDAKNARDDKVQEQRKNERKKKEMEVKLFQDQ